MTPVPQRPFRVDYDRMKPSAPYSHGLGVLGGSMITIGVVTYSVRKRVRALWTIGKLSRWLEFHIFLCLLGPVLVVYHSTFKAGGIAAISLWTMLSVAGSGVVGRFLYTQIPRNIKGTELTHDEIVGELERLSAKLASSPLGNQVIRMIDANFSSLPVPKTLSQAILTFVRVQSIRSKVKRSVRAVISTRIHSRETVRELSKAAAARARLIQKSLVLGQAEKLFHYWHVIHLPFSIIMFITLAAHVAVNVLLGYSWVF
jgi:hypothetical protein